MTANRNDEPRSEVTLEELGQLISDLESEIDSYGQCYDHVSLNLYQAQHALASLLELQRRQSAERPEPVADYKEAQDFSRTEFVVSRKDYCELLAYADRMAAERDAAWHRCPSCQNEFKQPFLCATCGAEKLYDATLRDAVARAESAESKLVRVEKLLREPSDAMLKAGGENIKSNGLDAHVRPTRRIWKAMSAELLRTIEERGDG